MKIMADVKKQLVLFSLIILSVYRLNAQAPSSNIVGFWPFNGNANDESVNKNHGTVKGATLVSDRFGNTNSAYYFDGNAYISIPHSATLSMNESLSFSVWVKPEIISGTRMIFGKSNYVSQTNYLLRVKSSGYLQWEYNGYTENDSVALQVNSWHHIVVTASGPGQIKKIYINNQLVKETLTSSGPFGFVSNPFTIGYASYGSEYFIGAVDDVRMYNKVLSEIEIDALFNESCNSINSIVETVCGSYTAPDGMVYTTSGIKTAVIPNAAGCDSIISINLTVNTVDVSVAQNGLTLSAGATADSYQWLDCDNDYAEIQGETNQSFSATHSGRYAVAVTQNNCVDISNCYSVTAVGLLENSFSNGIVVYPNPTDGILKIDLGESLAEFIVNIFDVNGRLISQSTYRNTRVFEQNIAEQPGVYLLTIISGNQKATVRLIKN